MGTSHEWNGRADLIYTLLGACSRPGLFQWHRGRVASILAAEAIAQFLEYAQAYTRCSHVSRLGLDSGQAQGGSGQLRAAQGGLRERPA